MRVAHKKEGKKEEKGRRRARVSMKEGRTRGAAHLGELEFKRRPRKVILNDLINLCVLKREEVSEEKRG